MKRYLIYIIMLIGITSIAATAAETVTPLYSTVVYKTLESMLNKSGKFNRVDFADGTSQPSAGLTGIVPMSQGGTGANTAAGARSNLGAAASGNNSDITQLNSIALSGTTTLPGNGRIYGNGHMAIGTTTTNNRPFSVVDSSGGGVRIHDGGGINGYVSAVGDNKLWLGNEVLPAAFAFSSSTFIANGSNGNVSIPRTGQPAYAFTSDENTGLYWISDGVFTLHSNGNDSLFINNTNIGIDTNTFGTGTNIIAMADGNFTGMPAISGQIEFGSQAGEPWVKDATGNNTNWGPHARLDELTTNLADPLPHTFVSNNPYLGKEKIIDMGALAEAVESLTGKKLITYKDIPKRDWTADQDNMRVQRDLDRLKKEDQINTINAQIAGIDNQLIISVVDKKKQTQLLQQEKDLETEKSRINKIMPAEYIPVQPPKWMQDRGVKLNL